MIRTAVLLTCYNRPTLVADAIASVLEQEPKDWRLYILDDGSSEETRTAIWESLANAKVGVSWRRDDPSIYSEPFFAKLCMGIPEDTQVVWWLGRQRTMAERRSMICYSYTINLALNYLLADEPYITYLCDDDHLLPGSLAGRADYLDQHPDVDVVYGRLRAVQYDAGGFNTWRENIRPEAGRAWRPPDGHRDFDPKVGNARHFYAEDGADPATGLGYVEEGFWLAGPMQYGKPHRIDHNQILHRRSCLTRAWPGDGPHEYWPESHAWSVGDAGFFTALAAHWPFVGVDCWAASKRYHGKSYGRGLDEVRE